MNTPRSSILRRFFDHFFPHAGNGYKPGFFSITSITVLLLAIAVFEAGYVLQTRVVFLKTDFLASVLPGALVALTNQDRSLGGITGVTEDTVLDQAAQAAANDMAASGYFAHVSPDGKTPWYWLDQAGYHYSYAGENLAVNFTDSTDVETAWMNSPTHRANIEKPQYTSVGIGVANGTYKGALATFVVQFFATPEPTVDLGTVAPRPVTVSPAPRVSNTPIEATPATSAVLGTETVSPASVASVSALGSVTALLLSPSSTLRIILIVLLILVASLLAVAIFVKIRVQHPHVLIGGAILIFVLLAALLGNSYLTHPVEVPAGPGSATTTVLP